MSQCSVSCVEPCHQGPLPKEAGTVRGRLRLAWGGAQIQTLPPCARLSCQWHLSFYLDRGRKRPAVPAPDLSWVPDFWFPPPHPLPPPPPAVASKDRPLLLMRALRAAPRAGMCLCY